MALALWLPMLTTSAGPKLGTRVLPLEAVQEAASTEGWALLTGKNAADSVAWLWLYLTPVVAILSAGALVWLALSRRGRLAGILAAWSCLVLLPALPFSNAFFPRYVVPAAVPLLIAAGFALGELTQRTRRAAAMALVAALLRLAGARHLRTIGELEDPEARGCRPLAVRQRLAGGLRGGEGRRVSRWKWAAALRLSS